MNTGWKVGCSLFVYINNRYRKGVLKSYKGGKWGFKPDRYVKTVHVCPIKNKWHYNLALRPTKWRQKIQVLFLGSKPFKFRKEIIGKWHGARTGHTKPVYLPVWQVPDSSTVIVGHLGAYTLATVHEGKLRKLTFEPHPNDQYFIGRGKLSGPTFKTLKIVDGNMPKRMRRTTKVPNYLRFDGLSSFEVMPDRRET